MLKVLLNLFRSDKQQKVVAPTAPLKSPAPENAFICSCGKAVKLPPNRHIIFKCPYCNEGYTAKNGVLVQEESRTKPRESKSFEIRLYILGSLSKIELLLKELHSVEPFTRKENEVLARIAAENNALFKKLLDFQENNPNDLGIAYHSYGKLTTISDKPAKVEVLMTFIFSALYKLQRESSFSLFEDYNHEMFTQKLLSINERLVKEWLN